MLVPHEERVAPWADFGHYGFARYRVWQRLTPFGMYQRHEWERADGSRSADKWILASGRAWLPEARASDETLPSETDLLLEAVNRIADGHNNPRALAIETLERIKDAA
jgi:hypothetical protein